MVMAIQANEATQCATVDHCNMLKITVLRSFRNIIWDIDIVAHDNWDLGYILNILLEQQQPSFSDM